MPGCAVDQCRIVNRATISANDGRVRCPTLLGTVCEKYTNERLIESGNSNAEPIKHTLASDLETDAAQLLVTASHELVDNRRSYARRRVHMGMLVHRGTT